MSLTPDLFQQIVELCKPYMQKVDERRARLFSAFLDSSLEDQISLNDSADVFVPNMLRVVMSRARYNGAHPLSILLKSLRELHGDEGRARIDALLPILDALPDGAPLPELPLRIVVSHDDADSAFAQRLRADLKCRHFTLLPRESQDALQAADHVLLVYGSDAPQRDREDAQRLCKPIIPLLRSAAPDDLPDALDFREDAAYDAAFERLLARLTPPAPLGDLIDLPSPPSYGFLKRPELEMLRDRVCALHSDQLNVQILYGIGGIGKSTLINQLCRDCDVRRRFPDGIIWLTIGAKGALESSLVALQSALETQAKRIQRAERDRRYLVVLDDIWETEFIERFCAKLQHYPRSSLLISTRKPEIADLAGFPKIALDKLDIPLSVQLLQMRLPEADPALCREIAVILDGHALALSIAAAWIARRGSGSAANLLNRLRERRIFEELSLQRENRNYHLEYSLRLSYEALRDESDESDQTPAYDLQYCFRQLGALAADGSFDDAAAAALWRLEGYALEDALADLVAEGLLTREGQQRYRMHSLLHAYARLLLDHANELRAADRQHFEYFSAQRSQHNRQQVTADFANIRKALLWTLEDDPRFAAEWTMQLYKHTVNLKREARRALLQDGLRAAQRADKPEAQAFMHRALGDLARAEGDRQRAEEHHQQALECFARATQRRPRDVIAWQMWALLAKERGQIEQARELFARAVEADENHAPAWQAWAITERDLGRYDEARRLFARAVEADERSAASWQAWAIMERDLGRYDEARRLFARAVEADERSAASWQAWAIMERDLGRYDEARRLFARAVEADERSAASWQAWAIMERDLGRYDEARRLFARAVEADERDAASWQAWAIMERDLKRYDEARRLFERAVAADEYHAPAWQAWAIMERDLKRYDEARRLFERAVAADEQSAASWQAWAIMERDLGRYDEARRLFERAVAADEQSAASWQAWAIMERDLKRYDEARRLFERAVAADEQSAASWQAWAIMERDLKRYDEARRLFERAVAADEYHAPAWQAWAIMERDLGRYDEARRLFARAVEADERDAASWQAWAIMERNLERHNEAKRLLEQGLQHVRDRRGKGLLHSTLGGLLASGGSLAAAEAHFRKALEYNDEDAMTHYHFAINVLLRANRREEACRHLCRAKALRIKKEHQRRMIESAIQRNGCQCRQ